MTTATAPIYIESPAYNSRIHMAARYVVRALHKTQPIDMLCDVVIPAGISPSFRRRAVERAVQAEFPMFYVPSRGGANWFVEHHEADEF